MASTFAVTRNHLIFGLCLPLAVLLGYLLADPQDSASMTIVAVLFAVLAVPILIRWYHPLLIFSWNSVIQPVFLPGRPQLWLLLALLGFLFAILSRAVSAENRFLSPRILTLPIVVLATVVVATALATGGLGLRMLGSSSLGGKGYIFIAGAILGYFALVSRPIPRNRAVLYSSIYFLSGLTSIGGVAATYLGNKFAFLGAIFPAAAPDDPLAVITTTNEMERLNGLAGVATALFCFLLSRYGFGGQFSFSKAWRGILFFGGIFVGMFSGFRSMLVFMAMVCAIMFVQEKLWRTRVILILAMAGVLVIAPAILFSSRLPLAVQRSLSFLPVDIDPVARLSAEASTSWRVEMWRAVWPLVPQYFFRGKGYNISPDELFLTQQAAAYGRTASWEPWAAAGDYHNGFLSVIIPLGIWGVLAFGWFLVAGARYLYVNFRDGPAELKTFNGFLFAYFLAKSVNYFVLFGALSGDLYAFTGLLGLSVAINSAPDWLKSEPQQE